MKAKTFGKKLTLNKKTVADLNMGQMKNAHGGLDCTIHRTNCLACTYTCANTCAYTCADCPTDCTCGTGDRFCVCKSIE
jgi:hypothetical protein